MAIAPNPQSSAATIPEGLGVTYNDSELEEILTEAGWPSADFADAIGVIDAESGGTNDPPNYAGATGIFQDLQSHWNGVNWSAPAGKPKTEAEFTNLLETDPVFNAQIALQLFHGSGWEPWETDSFVSSNPELLANTGYIPQSALDTVSGVVPSTGVLTGSTSGTPTSSSVAAGGASSSASIAMRLVLGLIGIILLAICVDQLFHDNTPSQTIIQGASNNARHVKSLGKGTKDAGETAGVAE